MTDSDFQQLPEADVDQKKSHISIVWLLPLVVILIGGWLVFKTLSEEGKTITIQFNTAEGIEAGKTKVKYLDVEVGRVTAVDIGGDKKEQRFYVLLTVEMNPGIDPYLTDASRFWVVRPRIGAGGVSGIGTLLSGAYIGMDPSDEGRRVDRFVGLERPPNVYSYTPGTRYRLKAAESTVSVGSPVLFRDIKVGEVTKSELAEDRSGVDIEIFVEAPHDLSVTEKHTRFWDVSGVDVKLSAAGLELEMGSLVSLVSGGIAFETSAAGDQAPADTQFILYKTRDASKETEITVTVPYVLHFRESVRGLSPGAPVEYRGIRLGTVKDIQFRPDIEKGESFIYVMINLEPQRIPFYPDKQMPAGAGDAARLKPWVERGLRARLQTGNLLTGQLFVELDMYPDAAPAEIFFDEEGLPVLPTLPGDLKSITNSITKILAQLEKLPIEEIGRDLQQTTAGVNQLVNSGELQQAVASLSRAATQLDSLIGAANGKVGPLLGNITRVSAEAETLVENTNAAVQKAEVTLAALNGVTSGKGPLGVEILRTLEELRAAMRAVRVMMEYLERHPEALLKGKRDR